MPLAPLLLLAVAAACLLLGSFPILAAAGLVAGSEPIEPLGRVVALAFGLVFVGFGVVLVAIPVRAAGRARGATTLGETAALARRHLVRRIDGGAAGAAAGVLALAAAYWATAAGASVPLLGADTLTGLVALEFLVLHGFPFLVITASFAAVRGGVRVLSVGVFGLVALNLAVLSWVFAGGLEGLVWLVYLLAGNVAAFVRKDAEVGVRARAVSRWALKLMLFLLLAGTVGGGDLEGLGALRLGAAYFTLTAVGELFRIAELPLDLARAASAPPSRFPAAHTHEGRDI